MPVRIPIAVPVARVAATVPVPVATTTSGTGARRRTGTRRRTLPHVERGARSLEDDRAGVRAEAAHESIERGVVRLSVHDDRGDVDRRQSGLRTRNRQAL